MEIILNILILIAAVLILIKVYSGRDNSEFIKGAVSETETRLQNDLKYVTESQNKGFSDTGNLITKEMSGTKTDIIENMNGKFIEIMKNESEDRDRTVEKLENFNKVLSKGLLDVQELTERKLDSIQKNVNERLDTALNERLDQSFNTVSKQLSDLYKGLGELQGMSDGISSLNKTLSNVKARGTWGEMQLGAILEDMLPASQYERNWNPKKNTQDVVEFAIRIPSKEDGKDIMLPLDSKFPTDIYNKVIEASDNGNPDDLAKARKELRTRIKTEARTIRDKYINVPVTTDFAVMFLPTESMYAEVIRIDGLMEECQRDCRVMIAGPQTITALISSLKVGFTNIAINKKADEIKKVLSAIKTQYSTLQGCVEDTKKKLEAAQKSNESILFRAEQINKKLKNVDVIENGEADSLLGLDVSDEQ